MLRSTALGFTSAFLTFSGLLAGWLAATLTPLSDVGFVIADGTATTGMVVGLCLTFIGSSLATSVAAPRLKGRRHARTAEQQKHPTTTQRGGGTPLEDQRRRTAALQPAVSEPLQMHTRPEQQHRQPGGHHPRPYTSVQSHLLGDHKMPTTTPPAPLPPKPIVTSMGGVGRGSAHSRDNLLPLTLTMSYLVDRPYEVAIWVAQRDQPAHPDATGWLVSREILCNAAIWETPAGLCDFWAVPMGEATTQLVFVATATDHRGEDLHVDVPRKGLLEFLGRTMRAVKLGHESRYLDISDGVLAAFMSGSDR